MELKLSQHTKGAMYCILGVLILSPDSLLVRKLQVEQIPDFAVIFYKYLLQSIAVLIPFFYFNSIDSFLMKVHSIGWIGAMAIIVWGSSNLLITYAFQTTAIANVLVINSSSPMFAALFSWLILKESVPLRTICTSIICFGAIFSIVYSQLIHGTSSATGLVCSIGAAVSLGLYLVLVRLSGDNLDPYLCNSFAALYICLISSSDAWILIFIDGFIILAIALTLLSIGPSLISAPEVSLYVLIETILGPLWVWLGGYEAPPESTIYGGTVLIVALVCHSILSFRAQSQEAKESADDSNMESSESGLELVNIEDPDSSRDYEIEEQREEELS